MEVRTLQNITLSELLTCFNKVFSDYFVTVQFNETMFQYKIEKEEISIPHSYGLFQDDSLIGFILFGIKDENHKNHSKKIYIAAHGIIPEFQGHKGSNLLFNHSLNELKKTDFQQIILEVHTENSKAITTYTSTGFKKLRTLNCYEFCTEIESSIQAYKIKETPINKLKNYNFVLPNPSWQHDIEGMNEYTKHRIKTWCWMEMEEPLAYVMYSPIKHHVIQIGYIANQTKAAWAVKNLLSYVQQLSSDPLCYYNVESGTAIDDLLHQLNFSVHHQQFEMGYYL